MWRENLEQHWQERTEELVLEVDADGSHYLNPDWIKRYAG
jgi:hypothetical protein